MKFAKLISLIITISFIINPLAYAKRFGSGRSHGVQRSVAPTNHNSYSTKATNNQAATSNTASPTGNTPRPGMGAGTAAAVGAVAGAAGGYMLGKSMANNNATASSAPKTNETPSQQTTDASEHSNFPWGIIGLLGLLLLGGLLLFKRKSNPQFGSDNNFNSTNNNFGSQANNRPGDYPQQPGNLTPQFFNRFQSNMQQQVNDAPSKSDRMADGIEPMYFLRQAKGMFLHIQSMNNLENINEIAKYMTPELYQEVKPEIEANIAIADFQNINAELLSTELKDEKILLASVKFSGLVSDEPGEQAKNFSEIWNFVKSDLKEGKWLVCGIQQPESETNKTK